MPIDMSQAVKAPPRKTGTRQQASRLQSVQMDTRGPNEKRFEGLLGLAQLLQGGCVMFGMYADAAAIGTHFPPVAKEVANIADKSEVVGKWTDVLIEVGPYSALLAAAMPLVMQIMANHRMLDASRLMGQGVVPPEVLEAQMKAQVTKMQADAMIAQQRALQEAQEAQRVYERMMAESQAA